MQSRALLTFVFVCLFAELSFATIFGTVRGIVHDPQHRPIQGAEVTLRARTSDWTRSIQTNADGDRKSVV